jgi:hypothetical protein
MSLPAGFPRGWLRDTLALYARVFSRGAALALRNWPVALVVVAYGVLLGVVRALTAPLGIVGGLLLYLVTVACASSWLSLVAEVLRVGRVRLQDVPAGFTAYLGDLLTVFFLFWGLSLIASLVLAPFPYLQIVFGLATLVFFNAVPELVYLGRHAPTALLVESYRFIGENWIEWFPANLALAACVLGARTLPDGPYGLVVEAATGLAFYFAMIVRGLLFQELAGSTRRAREFRRRAAG